MPDSSNIDKAKGWIQSNPGIFSKIISLAFLLFGIIVVVGAILNWDWLFKPDASYQNKWTIGQISRYLGRNNARILGLIGGLILVFAGGWWSYMAFFKK